LYYLYYSLAPGAAALFLYVFLAPAVAAGKWRREVVFVQAAVLLDLFDLAILDLNGQLGLVYAPEAVVMVNPFAVDEWHSVLSSLHS
jgi:hypothetical protein